MIFLLVFSVTDWKRPSLTNMQTEELTLVSQRGLDLEMHR